jgi:iron complex transport system substrate-binding protein
VVAKSSMLRPCFPPGRTGFLLPKFWITVACALACACAEPQSQSQHSAIVVRDDAAREVRLAAPARRVVSLMPTVTDLLIALRVHDRLVARTEFDTDSSIAHLPSLGGGLTPSVEWLAAQKPDLVISWPDQGSRSLVNQLARVQVPVYSARSESIEDTYRILKQIGELLDISAQSDSLAHAIRTGLDSVRSSVVNQAPVKVAYVVGVDPPMIAAAGTFIDELITIAGGQNIFTDLNLWPQVNLEDLLQRDPDVVILADTNTEDPLRSLLRLAGWRELRAVKDKRVFRVSPYFFNRSGPTMPRAAAELAEFFHGR